jgi:cyclopropane fatty-acyl-phospholipid synthase-like methyltransferase
MDLVSRMVEDGYVTTAVSMGVLEHVHETGGDKRASLAELSRVLQASGVLLVFHLPNPYTLTEFVVRQVTPWLSHPVHQHSRLFTRADVEQLLPPDLSIVECGRYNIIPRNPANALPDLNGCGIPKRSSPGSPWSTTQ